jgi:murein L,D-transpeptidase YcbB/YkuD
MLRGLIAGSVLAMSLVLTGCDSRTADSKQAGWSDAKVQQLREAIDRRAIHGLDHMFFAVEGQPGSVGGQAALTKSALRYASALAKGATDPTKLYNVYTITRPRPDLRRGLTQALTEDKLNNWIDSLAPQDGNYRKLSKEYLAFRNQDHPPVAQISGADELINPGATDQRIPAIARQLVASDYLMPASTQGDQYTPGMVRAMKYMQSDYGLKVDGVIGSDALEILNLSDADRARAIAVAMERLRWLDRSAPATRIDVNLAAGRLTYWRDGKIADSRKVVVGRPETETPQLESPIYQIVANPTWTVPRSIQNKEFAGKDAASLRRNNMVWKDGWIVQKPGPKNSLGVVKFNMKNKHAIYLHDTPAKQLFNEAQRQRSHGCVRVEDAAGFAEMLATDEGILDEWKKAIASKKESFVPLDQEIPVRLLYQTVIFNDAGPPVIRADPYGWNDRVSAALGFPVKEIGRLRPSTSDIGP